jgi:hypothetical protein
MPDANVHEFTMKLRSLLTRQTRVIDLALHALDTGAGVENLDELRQQKDVVEVVAMLVQGMGVSCHSIVKLTQPRDMAIRDCFGIARSICETGINVAYIISGGSEKASRAKQHALQKAYRNASRSWNINDNLFQMKSEKFPVPDEFPELREALAAFTTRRGRELTDWTPDNIEARLNFIEEKSKGASLGLASSFYSIYRHASEILHGTYFGVVYFWTIDGRPTSRDELERLFATNHLAAVFSAAYLSCHDVLGIIAQRFCIPSVKAANSALLHEVQAVILDFQANQPGDSPKDR